jgi:uncharacterized protein (DUF983 family)
VTGIEDFPLQPVWKTSILCRCPRCGQGPLFTGFLDVRPSCPSCGLDLTQVDTGDGPAVFVIFAVCILMGAGALWLEMTLAPPYWVHLVIWIPFILIFGIGLLRPFKAALVALQYKYQAREGELDG